ncbi:hypothetical protein ABH928_007290 [Streptacidiphilus sp. MAP5-3]
MRYGFDDAPIPTAKRTARASPREHAGARGGTAHHLADPHPLGVKRLDETPAHAGLGTLTTATSQREVRQAGAKT